jgi:membrane-bound metal-dependent hydrolase YbcI (DUF457 family)
MCLGHTHALSGAVTGSAASIYVLHLPLPQAALMAGLTAGAAVLPDIDHPNSTLARSFGFATHSFAWLVGKVSGGHRHGTHTLIGVAVFTVLAWLAVQYRHDTAGRIGLGVLLTLILAGALIALRLGGHWSDALAIGGAVAMTATGTGLSLVALAVGLGCATHITGDMCTDSGCPLLLPFSRYRFRLLPEPFAFTTATRPEVLVVTPALVILLAFLGYSAVR